MEVNDKPEFARAIRTMLYVVDNTHEVSDAIVRSYFNALEGWPLEVVQKAIDQAVAAATRHITPNELRERCRTLTQKFNRPGDRHEQTPSDEAAANDAFTELRGMGFGRDRDPPQN